MPAPNLQADIQEVPLNMVGGNKFGRYNKISQEETFNFLVSDDALVIYAGYKNVLTQSPSAVGRAIYSSTRGNIIIAVWGSGVYSISQGLVATLVGTIATS